MASESRHAAPGNPRRRRRTTRAILGAAVATAVGASGVYVATADAGEVAVPGALQAEAFSAQSGAQTESTSDTGGGKNVGWLTSGDWLEYRDVTINGSTISARIASDNAAGGSIEARLGAKDGTLLATFPIVSTGGWQKWTTVTATAAKVPAGAQDLFLVMKSTSRSDFVNINYLTLGSSSPTSAAPTSAAPTSAAPTPTAPGSAAPSSSPGGWVPVDQAAWNTALAQYNAVKALPVPAGTTMVPEFHTDCEVSGEAPDDPIVFPNLPGASHQHTFFGPKVTASSTVKDLLAASTTCNAPGDNSAYWAPTLLLNGKPVKMKSFRAYYGAKIKDSATVKPFPPGLVMVQGDPKRQVATPKGAPAQFWCAGSAEIGRSADGNWPRCAPGGNLIYQLTFQDCWDGKHIDSPDHKSHMGPAVDGVCKGDYPVAIPSVSLMLGYDSLGGDGLSLSSGMASSIHGDFMNAWDQAKLGALVKVCINAHAKCGITPSFTGG
ncbi:DUF1996 domain-containing protein [Actinoplanes teichomyceticus]|uniref:Carbohydrate binding protein with CBM6 domain n=1 Tax=Actinoplanes teichomyceticus TaxID=1867 RepID=A0A561VFY2_ACTTI|nr:DUF1996 domain-containing protein [Actinoplanes teichomyceticus]TWG10519.1 carbohydrate binding protein with CBM6 domain [Actinoplanes teichomyceticus]GIF15289.1 hypothetical protein Ate01nite_53210 [Actinoplanes teichomyceticus]